MPLARTISNILDAYAVVGTDHSGAPSVRTRRRRMAEDPKSRTCNQSAITA